MLTWAFSSSMLTWKAISFVPPAKPGKILKSGGIRYVTAPKIHARVHSFDLSKSGQRFKNHFSTVGSLGSNWVNNASKSSPKKHCHHFVYSRAMSLIKKRAKWVKSLSLHHHGRTALSTFSSVNRRLLIKSRHARLWRKMRQRRLQKRLSLLPLRANPVSIAASPFSTNIKGPLSFFLPPFPPSSLPSTDKFSKPLPDFYARQMASLENKNLSFEDRLAKLQE